MKRWGLRIWFLAVLICSFSCSLSWVRAEGLVQQGDEHKEYIKQHDSMVKAIGNFRPKEVSNGNYLLEVAKSQDAKFVALLLQQFVQLSYEPVTKTKIFEGDEAKAITKMLFGIE